jgi:uncharacterized protein YciI
MAELKQDPTHPLKHEQCYLCFMTLVEPPPVNAPSREELRRPHKEYMARLESEGRLFGAGLLKNDKEKETSDLGYGMFILRAGTRAEAEAIAFQEPNTKAGLRSMKVIPWGPGGRGYQHFDQLYQRYGEDRSAQLSIGQWLIWN